MFQVECANCIKLQTRERKLRNQYAGLKFKYDRLKRQGYKKRKQGKECIFLIFYN